MDEAAVIYTRLSRNKGGMSTGHSTQEADCRVQAARLGVPVVAVLQDDDISAFHDVERPAFNRLLAEIAAGEWSHVLYWKPDRLTRQPRDLARVEDAVAGAPRLVAVLGADGSKLEKGMGAAIPYLQAVASRYESEVKSDRVVRKQQDNREKGVQHAQAAFGLDTPEHAGYVREASRRILEDGDSLGHIALDWLAAGVRTRRGTAWTSMKLGRLLRTPALAGLVVHHGEILPDVVGQWEPVLAVAEWRRLVRVLDRRAKVRGDAKPALLRGMVYCGRCDEKMTTVPRADRDTSGYHCYRGCKSMNADVANVDRVVETRALAILSEETTRKALQAAQAGDGAVGREELLTALEADRALLSEIEHDRYQTRMLSRASYLQIRPPIDARIAQTMAELERLDAPVVDLPSPADVLDAWNAAPLLVRQVWLGAILDRAFIDKPRSFAPAFDPQRVRCVWLI